MRLTVFLILLFLAVGIVSLFGIRGCTSREPPVRFWPGMVDQNKAIAQSPSAFFADGVAARMPPTGTVPFGRSSTSSAQERFAYDIKAAYAAKEIPVPIDAALVDRGQAVFARVCALCHGAAGDGQGIVTKYGMTNPPTFHSARLRALTDGSIFQTITEGKNTMGPQGERLTPEERWAAVAWLRVLQRSQDASIDDVPAARRGELNR